MTYKLFYQLNSNYFESPSTVDLKHESVFIQHELCT